MKGVYIIENKLNGNCYIGSSKRLEFRLRQHKSNLKGGYHENKRIQSDWDVNPNSFEFRIIEVCDNYKEVEQKYIDNIKPSYNIYPSAYNPSGSKWERGHSRHKFIQVYTEDKLIGIYVGPKDVSDKLKISYSSVNGVLSGSRNSVYGYKIQYI